MKLSAVKKVEDCLDGSMIKDFHLDAAIDRAFIEYLGGAGRLEYFPTFARPFFRVTRDKGFILKGVEGNTMFQAIFIGDIEARETELCSFINAYQLQGGD